MRERPPFGAILFLVFGLGAEAFAQSPRAGQFFPDFPEYAVGFREDGYTGVRMGIRIPYRRDEQRLKIMRGIEYALSSQQDLAISELKPLANLDFEARKWLAFVLLDKGSVDEAASLIEVAGEAQRDRWCLWALGTRNWMHGDFVNAAHMYKRSLEQEYSLFVAECLARALCKSEQYGAFADVLGDCYVQHPELRGGYGSSSPNPLITEADKEHGKIQVENVCRDRGELALLVAKSESLRLWLVARFGGVRSGRKVLWCRFPFGNRVKSFGSATNFFEKGPPMVWVDNGTNLSDARRAEWQLSTLVYELLNAEEEAVVLDLQRRAKEGSISRERYIRENARSEYNAHARRRAFFQAERIFDLEIEIRPEDWSLNLPFSFEEYFAQFKKDALYPYHYFGRRYDETTSR